MVGQQIYSPQNTLSLTVESLIPKNNFYRRLKQILDLGFLYEWVQPYYGSCGHKSVDPVVFFKLLLVRHLENISSDRALIQTCQLRLDVLYFLDYQPGQKLPFHSTISRTRKRLPTSVFESLFEKVLSLYVEKGMINGQMQAIDGAFVEANASLDSLERKAVQQWVFLKGDNHELDNQNNPSINDQIPPFLAIDAICMDRATKTKRPARNNTIYQSKTDPQARLAQKPGKPFRLYYLSSMIICPAWPSMHMPM